MSLTKTPNICELLMCDRPAANNATRCRPHLLFWAAVAEDDAAPTPAQATTVSLEALGLIDALHADDGAAVRELLNGTDSAHRDLAIALASIADDVITRLPAERDQVITALRAGLIDGSAT